MSSHGSGRYDVPLGAAASLIGDLPFALDMLSSMVAALPKAVARPARPTDVSVAQGADALDLVAEDWQAVELAGGAVTPFQTLAVARASVPAHLRRGEVPRIAVVRERGRVMVVFPAVIGRFARRPVVRFLGDPLIQYGDVLASPDATPAHVAQAWGAVADPAVASAVYLRKVRADARIAPLLAAMTTTVAQTEAPFVDLAQPSRQPDSKQFRRFRRKLEQHGAVHCETVSGPAARATVIEALELKRQWLAARGFGSSVVGDPQWENTLAELAAGLDGAGPLRAARLTVDGRTAAIELGMLCGPQWCSYLGATAPAFARCGAGHVLTQEIISHGRAEGLSVYDLLAPPADYKRAIQHGAVAVRDHAVALTLDGRLSVLALRMAPGLKAAVGAMPDGVRRMLMGWWTK
jgi:CelD/BcsL family acetyltransferase involved in cellulose biosynthesis